MLWLLSAAALVVISPVVALAPLPWAFRLWTAIAFIFATTVLLQGKVQFQDQGFIPSELVVGSLAFILALSLIVIILRRAHSERSTLSSGRFATLSTNDRDALNRLDHFIAFVAGLCASLLLALLLAIALRGSPGGLAVHFAVAGMAAVGMVASLRCLRGLLRTAAATALPLVAGLTLAGGFLYPQLIASKAAAIDPNSPRCLRAVDVLAAPDDTRLLTLPRGQPGGPGLILTVMAPQGAKHFRWSYRSLTFTPYGAYRYGSCPA